MGKHLFARQSTQASRFLLLGLAGLALSLPFAPQDARALSLELISGGSDVIVNSGGVNDALHGTAGAVGYIGSVGDFVLNVTVGASTPILGSASSPNMDLSSLNISSWGGGTLTVKLTDTNFINNNPAGFQIASAIGGVTQGTMSLQTYFDSGNQAFGLTNLLADLGGPGGFSGAFSGASSNSINGLGLYSLTMVANIDHGSGGGVGTASSFNASLKVPEPSTVLLLGAAMLILGILAWFQKGVNRQSVTPTSLV